MTFDEWHEKQLNGDPDNCPHREWERIAWDSAINFCVEAAKKEVLDWTILRDIAIARGEFTTVEGTSICPINRVINCMELLRSNAALTGAAHKD